MALRWPSRVCRTVLLISCSFLPRNCSEAVCSSSGFFMIFTCNKIVFSSDFFILHTRHLRHAGDSEGHSLGCLHVFTNRI